MPGFAKDWLSDTWGWGWFGGLCAASTLALGIALLPVSWTAFLVLGGIVLVLTLLHPQLGLVLLIPAVPFGSLHQVRVGVMNVGLTEALVALVLVAWLFRSLARRETRLILPALSLPLVVLLMSLSLSVLGAISLQHSLKELFKWVEVLALYLAVANEVDAGWRRILIAVVLGTGAAAALQGIYQFLFRVGPEGFLLFDRFMRAHGTFDQPNPYAGYLGLTLPLAVGLVVAGLVRVDGRLAWRWIAWAAGCAALLFVAMVMSWSRGAWLGLAAALSTIALAAALRSGRAAVLGGLLALFVVYLLLAGSLAHLPAGIIQRFSDFVPYLSTPDVRGVEITDANFAVLERMAHWQSALAMWRDHPWLGVGIGNYEPVYTRYALPQWPLPLGHAHNYYLNIAAEAGVLGLGAYLVVWGTALVEAWRAARRLSGWEWGVALGVLGVLVHLSVHNLFDNLYVHALYIHVAVLLGCLVPNPEAARCTARICDAEA